MSQKAFKPSSKERNTLKGLEKFSRNYNAARLTKTEGSFMGGGMMQRPMMAMGGGMMPGYKKGKSVMAKGCKLGRKKPTKMYT